MADTPWRLAVADRMESAAAALRRRRDNECLKELGVAIGYLKLEARRRDGAFGALAFLEAMFDLFGDSDDTRRLEFDPQSIREVREEMKQRRSDTPRSAVRVSQPSPPPAKASNQ